MRKIIGLTFIVVGLVLVGLGSYDGFERYGQDLFAEDKKNYYDGLYLTAGDSITVYSENKDDLKVSINNETYEFYYNGKYYENKESGFYIIFDEDNLVLYKDGEQIRTLKKEK